MFECSCGAELFTQASMPWWVADYLGARRRIEMSAAQRGIYIDLLSLQWQGGGLPQENYKLATLACLPLRDFELEWVEPLSSAFVPCDHGRLWNPKCEEVRRWLASKVRNGRVGGMASGVARAESKRNRSESRSETPSETPSETQAKVEAKPEPSPTSDLRLSDSGSPTSDLEEGPRSARPTRRRSREQEIADVPEHTDPAVWTRWVTHLWQRKRPTETALAGHREKLAALGARHGAPAVAALLGSCIDSNAQGIPPWAYEAAMNEQGRSRPGGPILPPPRLTPAQAALARVLAKKATENGNPAPGSGSGDRAPFGLLPGMAGERDDA